LFGGSNELSVQTKFCSDLCTELVLGEGVSGSYVKNSSVVSLIKLPDVVKGMGDVETRCHHVGEALYLIFGSEVVDKKFKD